jgi:hypothetical protein
MTFPFQFTNFLPPPAKIHLSRHDPAVHNRTFTRFILPLASLAWIQFQSAKNN